MIDGVLVRPLTPHPDGRGSLIECFRSDWGIAFEPVQWHVLCCRPGSLRGMHLHLRHDDYKVVVAGRQTLVLADTRGGQVETDVLELSGERPQAVLLPAGVAHGVYSHDDSVMLVGSDVLYDGTDDFEFAWSDPAVVSLWPGTPEHLSERDRNAPSLDALLARL